MKPEMILQADLLDILFENRNKEYGAYALRKSYPRVMHQSIAGMLLIVFIFFALLSWKVKPEYISEVINPISDTLILINPIGPIPPPPAIPPSPPIATLRNVIPIIVTGESDTIPTIDEPGRPVQTGTTTSDGIETDVIQPLPDQPAIASVPEAEAHAFTITPYHSVEEMPEFPGGEKALQRFLNKHLKSPEKEIIPGTTISVRARFVIDANGNVSTIEMVKSGGEKFDREVMRVLNKMPQWKPGKQNGMFVSVYYIIPVIFQEVEE